MLYLQILYFHLYPISRTYQDMLHFQQWINSQRRSLTVQMTVFTDGEFEIEISINAEETNTKTRFKVYVDTNYINLRMNMLPLTN